VTFGCDLHTESYVFRTVRTLVTFGCDLHTESYVIRSEVKIC